MSGTGTDFDYTKFVGYSYNFNILQVLGCGNHKWNNVYLIFFVKFRQLFQKLKGGRDGDIHRWHVDLISLCFFMY
jgi:hypothetical protein